jgi:hypothetical protein
MPIGASQAPADLPHAEAIGGDANGAESLILDAVQVDLKAVLRAFMEALADEIGQETIAKRGVIKSGNLSKTFSKREGREFNIGQVNKLSAKFGIPLSELLRDLSDIARTIERRSSLPPEIAGRSLATAEFADEVKKIVSATARRYCVDDDERDEPPLG